MNADRHRAALGFLSLTETDALASEDVRILDPASTLITAAVTLAPGTVVYPGVVIDASRESSVVIGERVVLYPGCVLEARDGAKIQIGADSELGPGGVTIRVSGPHGRAVLSEQVRLSGGCELTGTSELGVGCQILGAISARSVTLGGGLGGHSWPVPDERGAVLKGTGLADGTILSRGQVKSCRSSFADAPSEQQSRYHPTPDR